MGLSNYYDILGCDVNDTDEVVKKAYRRKALEHHPDRHADATDIIKEQHTEKFKELSTAYAKIMKARSGTTRPRTTDSDSDADDFEYTDFLDDDILEFFDINVNDIQQFNEVVYLLNNDALINTFGSLVFNQFEPHVFSPHDRTSPSVTRDQSFASKPFGFVPPVDSALPLVRLDPQREPKPLIIKLEFRRRSFERHVTKTLKLKLGPRVLRVNITLNKKNKIELDEPIDVYRIDKNKYMLPRSIIIHTGIRASIRTGVHRDVRHTSRVDRNN